MDRDVRVVRNPFAVSRVRKGFLRTLSMLTSISSQRVELGSRETKVYPPRTVTERLTADSAPNSVHVDTAGAPSAPQTATLGATCHADSKACRKHGSYFRLDKMSRFED